MTINDAFPALLLAAGRSSRMGQDKAGLLLAGKPLGTHTLERLRRQTYRILVNAAPASAAWAERLALPVVSDTMEGFQGPLAGILAGLRAVALHYPQARRMLSVPVDTPFFPPDLLARLSDAVPDATSVAVAASGQGVHRVVALWPLSIADDLERWLTTGDNRRMRDYLDRLPVKTVAFAERQVGAAQIDPFFNINTREDLAHAERLLANGLT